MACCVAVIFAGWTCANWMPPGWSCAMPIFAARICAAWIFAPPNWRARVSARPIWRALIFHGKLAQKNCGFLMILEQGCVIAHANHKAVKNNPHTHAGLLVSRHSYGDFLSV